VAFSWKTFLKKFLRKPISILEIRRLERPQAWGRRLLKPRSGFRAAPGVPRQSLQPAHSLRSNAATGARADQSSLALAPQRARPTGAVARQFHLQRGSQYVWAKL
jgi:hypothetical protein